MYDCYRFVLPTAVVVIGLMVPIIALGEYSNNLVVNASGTTYDELSCEEKEDLRENIDSMNLTGVSPFLFANTLFD